MRSFHPGRDEDGGSRGPTVPLWFITFSDLMALLVGFFVMLYGFSTLEANRFRALAGSVRDAFGGPSVVAPGSGLPTDPPRPQDAGLTRGSGRAALYEKASAALREMGYGPLVEAELDGAGVRLRVQDSVLFSADGTDPVPEAGKLLDLAAQLALRAGGGAVVEGHTDNQPLKGDRYPTNWELAGARSSAIVRELAARGVPSARLEARSYGASRPRRPNQTYEGRQNNRRVEIIIQTER
jgi:chemotaxis protein MotB